MDFLKSAVASAISKGPAFGFTFGDRVDIDHAIWTLHNGTKRVSRLPTQPSAQSELTRALPGRRLKVQYILVRLRGEQVPIAACEECAEKASDPTTSRRDPGDRRGRDGGIYLYRDGAVGATIMACAKEDFVRGDNQMGVV